MGIGIIGGWIDDVVIPERGRRYRKMRKEFSSRGNVGYPFWDRVKEKVKFSRPLLVRFFSFHMDIRI